MAQPLDLIGDHELRIEGDAVRSHDPARPARTVWAGSPRVEHVDLAVESARRAAREWSAWPIERRAEALRRFAAIAKAEEGAVADALCDETGKALWEARAEAALLAQKVETTLLDGAMSAGSGRARITGFEIPIASSRRGRCSTTAVA